MQNNGTNPYERKIGNINITQPIKWKSKKGLIRSRKKQRTKNNSEEETNTLTTNRNSENNFQSFVYQGDQDQKIELVNIINFI